MESSKVTPLKKDSLEFEIRPICDFSEQCAAWHLVYKRYRDSGFIQRHPSGLHFGALDLLPSSATWGAFLHGRLVGTMSTVIHSSAGIPSGGDYLQELEHEGIDGRIVVELTKLALDDRFANDTRLILELASVVLWWCWRQRFDDVICVCHPKHGGVWESVFGLKPIGLTRGHSGVNGNPGILLDVNLNEWDESFSVVPARGRRLLRKLEQSNQKLTPSFRLSPRELMLLLLQKPECLLEVAPEVRAALFAHYPWSSRQALNALLPPSLSPFFSPFSKDDEPRRNPEVLTVARAFLDRHLCAQNTQEIIDSQHLSALVLSSGNQLEKLLWGQFESDGVLVVFEDDIASASESIGENLLDLIFFPERLTKDSSIERFTQVIRNRDEALKSHTPILTLCSDYDEWLASCTQGDFERVSYALGRVWTLLEQIYQPRTASEPNFTPIVVNG